MTPQQALAFIRKHGIVLEAAAGSVPSLAAAIAGEPVQGSWWVHPRGQEIFEVTRAVRESPDVLVCRLVDGKITYVHRRLWPALVRSAPGLPADRVAQVREVHAEPGRHRSEDVAFPEWVPAEVTADAAKLAEDVARARLGEWGDPAAHRRRPKRKA